MPDDLTTAGVTEDPIAMEVFANRLLSISEEMGNALIRSSFSTNIKERRDCSVGLLDAAGRCVTQAAHMPMHLGSLLGSVIAVLDRHPAEAMQEGDSFICNDVFLAHGTHQPDITIVTPIFHGGRVRFFAANVGHHSDVGGPHPGSMSQSARTIFEEGIRIPVMRFTRGGQIDEDLLNMIAHNTREPDERALDLRVQVAVNQRGAELMHRLVAAEGIEAVERSVDDLLRYTRRRLRSRISALPDGTYHGERWMDGDGIPGGEMLPLRASVTIRGSDMMLDFAGTGPQARGALNLSRSGLEATCAYAVKAMLDPDIPPNTGLFGGFGITAPEGTIVNPRFPAATCTRAITANRVAGAIIAALNQAVTPDRRMAASNDSVPAMVISGRRATGTYVYIETIGGGIGAALGQDGMEASHVHLTNSSNLPAEALEIEYPVLLDEYALIEDSGGAGQWRGGLGIARQIRSRSDETVFTARSDGHIAVAPGLDGGLDGGGANLTFFPAGGPPHSLGGSATAIAMVAGAAARVETPGGAGFGDPAKRDPMALGQDLADGKTSRKNAVRDYGEKAVTEAESLHVTKG
jgi:N-methylhydantoinase B